MSDSAREWVFTLGPGEPKLNRRFVLLALADHENHVDYRCDPSIERLSKRLAMSEKTVGQHLHALAEGGFITINSRASGTGRWARNTYRLHVPAALRALDRKREDSAPRARERPLADFNDVTPEDRPAPSKEPWEPDPDYALRHDQWGRSAKWGDVPPPSP